MDRKGRIVIPKNVRDAARIIVPTRLLAIAKHKGTIELIIVDTEMKTAKAIATRKFAGWREEDHEADSLAFKLLKGKNLSRLQANTIGKTFLRRVKPK